MESLQEAASMLQNIAYHCNQDYEDLYQVAAETAVEAYDRAQATDRPRAYLHRAIRLSVLKYAGATKPTHRVKRLSDYYQTVSLDAPRTSSGDLSLYDLVSEAAPAGETRDFSRLHTLYVQVRTCPACPSIYAAVEPDP